MLHRFQTRLLFLLERWLQRGALFQLAAIAGLIVLVACLGGLIAWAFAGTFADPGEAIWWAFLRLTDPGYLGDDAGLLLRTVSTAITVLGYVLFMGSLIAILTQWLNATMRRLERGLTPIAIDGHILILGWTNRTPTIVRELLLSEGRVTRFLRHRGTRRLRIVILADEVDSRLRQELRDELGIRWHDRRILFRSGSSLRIEHLHRVDYTRAAVIILPGADFAYGPPETADTRTIKTLLSLMQEADVPQPTVVAEVLDAYKLPIAQQAYRGALDLIASDAFISRLIAQNVRHRGLSFVYTELLSYQHGHEVYVRWVPDYAGTTVQQLSEAFPEAIVLGVVRPADQHFTTHLNPPPGFVMEREDRLVLIASSYEATAPAPGFSPEGEIRRHRTTPAPLAQPSRRILVLGWSHKVRALLREFSGYPQETFRVDVLSVVPAADRTALLARHLPPTERVQVRQLEGDYTVRADLLAVAPATYDNVVFLGSDWLDSDEESDARTVLGYVLLRALLPADGTGPDVLVELMDPENARLFRQRPGEVIISPLILSHMLAHVALRRELNAVFGELFGPGGAEIFFRPAADYELVGTEVSFRDIRRTAARYGEIALGVRLQAHRTGPDGGIVVNPAPSLRWRLTREDELVVLTTT